VLTHPPAAEIQMWCHTHPDNKTSCTGGSWCWTNDNGTVWTVDSVRPLRQPVHCDEAVVWLASTERP